jgi:hypothetical protein
MSREIDHILPISVNRVGDTCFSDEQVDAMIERTNRKLFSTALVFELKCRRGAALQKNAWLM